ncbi:unnamed protein product, partial [Effrenium voratum]
RRQVQQQGQQGLFPMSQSQTQHQHANWNASPDTAQERQAMEGQVQALRLRYPFDDAAYNYIMASQPSVIKEVLASFKPPKEGEADYSALVISFAKKCRSNAFSDARQVEDQAEYESFRQRYPFDDDTHNYMQTSNPDVRRYVMRNFKPPREGEADYSALLITYCKRCRSNMTTWGKGAMPISTFTAKGSAFKVTAVVGMELDALGRQGLGERYLLGPWMSKSLRFFDITLETPMGSFGTIDHDLERIDLHQTNHIPWRGRLRKRANVMAGLFNEASLGDIEAYEWMVSDVTHPRFGEKVDEIFIQDGVTLGDSALIELDGQEVYVRRTASSEKASIIVRMDSTRGDDRLLGFFTDAQGKRFLDFKTALGLLKEVETNDWHLQGPKVAMELLKAVRSGPGDLATYHLTWVKNSAVNPYGMVAHDHRILCNILRGALETDQINVCACISFELICRRLVQIETAVARNSQSPDFTGLELILEDPIVPGGEASTSTFNAWLATKMKERANVAKQTRLFKEEFRNSSGHQGAWFGLDDPKTYDFWKAHGFEVEDVYDYRL